MAGYRYLCAGLRLSEKPLARSANGAILDTFDSPVMEGDSVVFLDETGAEIWVEVECVIGCKVLGIVYECAGTNLVKPGSPVSVDYKYVEDVFHSTVLH